MPGNCLVEIGARRGVAGAKPDELEALDRLIGARVAHSHRAEANDEHVDALALQGVRVVACPFDLPRISRSRRL